MAQLVSPKRGQSGFGTEAHDDLADALVYLILGLVEHGLELPKIHWIDG
jgi:hypothetical protein